MGVIRATEVIVTGRNAMETLAESCCCLSTGDGQSQYEATIAHCWSGGWSPGVAHEPCVSITGYHVHHDGVGGWPLTGSAPFSKIRP